MANGEYIYNDVPTSRPDLQDFVSDVRASDMTNKKIRRADWNADEDTLVVNFDADLSSADKTILDTLVSEITAIKENKDRSQIMAEILGGATSQEQLVRLLDAMDSYGTSFIACLDNLNYSLAMTRVQRALDAAAITQADYDLIDSIVPS